ncbi:TRAP transporter substrate-binding protein DctP [Microbacterium sp. No. 7]|uniref:TRAP transporter substrate-binding protein DctP n=1 Tax=Microbacterium sp. No. 7 TaxID=1714373 RepID=UPI0006CF482E|nr:TRAP transporter substrate-binding protein DctP [Microbacterium sp. No. 7]ALJ21687.1 hypothetical protein AOA12_18025 [Microbacterium sp. No. 7]
MSVRRRGWATLTVGVSLALALTACTAGTDAPVEDPASETDDAFADLDPITITYADQGSETASNGVAFLAFADEVTRKTGGKVTFEYFWSASLATGPELLPAASSGLADMVPTPYVYQPQELPNANWTADLLSLPEKSLPFNQVVTNIAINDLLITNDVFVDEYAAQGLKPLAANAMTPYHILCREPVDTLADAAGKRIRAAGATWVAEAEAIGMVPTSLPTTEMYEGLQRGVIDCVSINLTGLLDWGLFEVAHHLVTAPMSGSSIPLLINLDTWDSLPPAVQEVFEEAAATWLRENIKTSLAQYADAFGAGGQGAVGTDLVLHAAPEIRKALAAHQAAARDALPGSAPSSIADPAAVIRQFEDAVARWEAKLADEAGIEPIDPDLGSDAYKTALAEAAADPKLATFLDEAAAYGFTAR